jgi:hypothetical protein
MFKFISSLKSRFVQLQDAAREQSEGLHRLEETLREQAASQQHLIEALRIQAESQQRVEAVMAQQIAMHSDLVRFNPHFTRNFLSNDDAAIQKILIATWQLQKQAVLNHQDLLDSGFRVFSQNDEDGILLRLFTHIGYTNRYVIEIGSNCSGSDVGIPENLSANLIVNHRWHGAIFEMDQNECSKMRYFFARDSATRHFHWARGEENTYFSPLIINQAVSPENINDLLINAGSEPEPDLMVIDIDGGDYAVMQNLQVVKPRVLVVEFEKRFRDRYSVVQPDRENFGKSWPQSGAASLLAWQKQLDTRGYILVAISSSGFNAFFVRSDVAACNVASLTATEAFSSHAVFSKLSDDFWLTPDETWQEV